jgi:hypothetical protein
VQIFLVYLQIVVHIINHKQSILNVLMIYNNILHHILIHLMMEHFKFILDKIKNHNKKVVEKKLFKKVLNDYLNIFIIYIFFFFCWKFQSLYINQITYQFILSCFYWNCQKYEKLKIYK